MIGKVDRIDNLGHTSAWDPFVRGGSVTYVNIVAEALKRKYSGLAPHIPIGDMGLYAEHSLVHRFTAQRCTVDVA